MFWNIFVKLCDERGVKPNTVCRELKFSNATATKWKGGSVPSGTTLKKIADYFNVSVDYLLGKTDQQLEQAKKESPSLPPNEQWEQELLEDARKLSPEVREEIIDFVRYKIQKESGQQ